MATRGRKKGDGRGRLGGRAKGVPNDNNPLKGYLKAHSYDYFKPGDDGYSQFDIDLLSLEPEGRISAEIRILEYHTPKMKSVEHDISNKVADTLSMRLRDLASEEEEE